MSVFWGMRPFRLIAIFALIAVTVVNFVVLHKYAGRSPMLRRITGFVMASTPSPTPQLTPQSPPRTSQASLEIEAMPLTLPEVSPLPHILQSVVDVKDNPAEADSPKPSVQPQSKIEPTATILNQESKPIFPNLRPQREYFVSMCMPTVRRVNATGQSAGYLTAVLAEYANQMRQGRIDVPYRIVVMKAGNEKHEEYETVKQIYADNPVFEFVTLPETDNLEDVEKPRNRRVAQLHVYHRVQDSWTVIPDTDIDRYDLHVLRLKDNKAADDLIDRTQKWCKRRQDCQGFVHVTTPEGRQESFLKSNVREEVRKPYTEALLPEVVQQSLDVSRLAKYCAINSQFVMFLEDDFFPCPNALQTSIAILESALACHPKGGPTSIGTVVTCRGMNGVAIEGHRVPQYTAALRKVIYSTPCDLLIYDPAWLTQYEPWKFPQVLYQTNLFEHVGNLSSFAFRNTKPFLDSAKDLKQRNVKCDTVQPGWKRAKSGILTMDDKLACNFVQNASPSPAPSPPSHHGFPPANPQAPFHKVAPHPQARKMEERVF